MGNSLAHHEFSEMPLPEWLPQARHKQIIGWWQQKARKRDLFRDILLIGNDLLPDNGLKRKLIYFNLLSTFKYLLLHIAYETRTYDDDHSPKEEKKNGFLNKLVEPILCSSLQ